MTARFANIIISSLSAAILMMANAAYCQDTIILKTYDWAQDITYKYRNELHVPHIENHGSFLCVNMTLDTISATAMFPYQYMQQADSVRIRIIEDSIMADTMPIYIAYCYKSGRFWPALYIEPYPHLCDDLPDGHVLWIEIYYKDDKQYYQLQKYKTTNDSVQFHATH